MKQKSFLLISIIISLSILGFHPSFSKLKAEENYGQIEQLAKKRYWEGNYLEAINLWISIVASLSEQQQAEIHSYLGVAYKQLGQTDRSIYHFQQSLNRYTKLEDKKANEIKIELANLFNDIGQGGKAIALGKEVLDSPSPEERLIPLALQAIATGYLLSGELDTAIEIYRQAQSLASNQPEVLIDINNNLGIALLKRRDLLLKQASLAETEGFEEEGIRLKSLADGDYQSALSTFTDTVKLVESNDRDLYAIRTYLNAFQVSRDRQYLSEAVNLLPAIPADRSKAQILIDLAQFHDDPYPLLQQASEISQSLGDHRTYSFALGVSGAHFEREQQYTLALEFTQKAQLFAQLAQNYDSLYQWQWQAGRLYKSLGQPQKAKEAYRSAIATLEKLRKEIASANPEFQLDIIEKIQPIYRELLSLLLSGETETLNKQQVQEILEIRNQLELAGLQGFFGDVCLELQQQTDMSNKKELQQGRAKIHFILLEENAYQILELPDGSFLVFALGISKANLEAKLLTWREMLLTSRIPKAYEPLSQELYQILLGQVISLLPPDTEQLVFVGDGLLRNVPLTALMDGDTFLIEKYAISYSLGLPIAVKPNNSQNSVAFGLSVGTEYSPPLPFVPQEITSVSNILRGRKFIDSDFTKNNFREQMQGKYGIIHIATHAIFAGSAEETYFQVFDSIISMDDLEILLRRSESLQLLFLSACRTAVGNERSVLGLAGVGARLGSNVVASLWSVRDEATSYLVADFYSSLKEGTSQAESLREAQLNLLHQYPHPKFWSAFILIAQ